jgi:hypothetical protein
VATHLQPIHFAPRDEAFRGVRAVGELKAFVRNVACNPSTSYLVFYFLGDQRVVSLAEIRRALDVTPVAAAADGAMFLVEAGPRRSCPDVLPGATRLP